jgi:aspartate oxidase
MPEKLTDTCKGSECFFWKAANGKCPNYMEFSWNHQPTGEVYITQDCATVRNAFMLREILIRMEGFQRAQEEQRNASTQVMQNMVEISAKAVAYALKRKEIDGGTGSGNSNQLQSGDDQQ